MSDLLTIENLELMTRIGLTDEERKEPQQLLLSVQWATDALGTAKTDEPPEQQNYENIAKALRSLAQTPRRTIERLAEDAADLLLTQFGAPTVSVTVRESPFPDAQSIVLTITRP